MLGIARVPVNSVIRVRGSRPVARSWALAHGVCMTPCGLWSNGLWERVEKLRGTYAGAPYDTAECPHVDILAFVHRDRDAYPSSLHHQVASCLSSAGEAKFF